MPISFGEFKQSHFPTEKDVRKQKKKDEIASTILISSLPFSSSLKNHRRKKGENKIQKLSAKVDLNKIFVLPQISRLSRARHH